MKMKNSKYYLIFIILFTSCFAQINDFTLEDTAFSFNLTNYTDKSWEEGTLYVGAKNSLGLFIATDSVKYKPIVSNISPVNIYTEDEYSSNGKYQGYHYYKFYNSQYVTIPFPIITYGTLKIEKEKIEEISSKLGFIFKLSDGEKVYVEAFDINKGAERSRFEINFNITASGLVGEIKNDVDYD